MSLESISIDTLKGVVALLLAIIGIYYTHRSVRSPILLETRKRHTVELIDFLRGWYDKFPLCESAIEPETTSGPLALVEYPDEAWHKFPTIELDWRYEDIIRYHLPKGYETLPVKWEEYKKVVNEYRNMRYQLYGEIKKEVCDKTGLKYDPNWRNEHIVSKHFVKFIYQQYISWIKYNKLYFDRASLDYKEERNELWCSSSGLAKGIPEERNKAREVFEEMMFNRDYLEKYKIGVSKIIEAERKLEVIYKETQEMLKKLIGYPLLPGTKCEMLRNVKRGKWHKK